MGCCLRSLQKDERKTNSTPETDGQYTLHDLRSLEGVARLWSQNIEQTNGHNARKPLQLSKGNSLPIFSDNHKSLSKLPFSISTYYFVHSELHQPRLLKSHTSPKLALGTSDKWINAIREQSPEHTPDSESEDIKHENRVIARSIPYPPDPNIGLCDAIPNIALNLMPVFSTSSYAHSPSLIPLNTLYTTQLSLNDNALHIGGVSTPDKPGNESLFKKRTVSNLDLFTLNNIDLNKDDFMEYDTDKIQGFGASGFVKKAFHFSSCKMVAIKHCRSKQFRELKAFEQEAKLYKKFKTNRNIIDIIGYGTDEKTHEAMMALEYMDLNSAITLRIHETIADMGQRERIVGYIAHCVLLALADLHENLYVHNDVKPDNILVNKYGEIKLSDFGVMLQIKKNGFLSVNNGTRTYQSPEKTIFNIKYNTSSDIWSLGITCYELLFGENESISDEISYTTNPPYIDSSTHNVSINCCRFINQCLTVNQYERPTSRDLLKHEWFAYNIEEIALKDKWEWLINIEENMKNNDYLNEDLFFMISALIIYYSTKRFNDINSGSIARLHRRVSIESKDKNYGESFSDEQRIANMAKYALCSKDTVVGRISVTVAYIKSQLGNISNHNLVRWANIQ